MLAGGRAVERLRSVDHLVDGLLGLLELLVALEEDERVEVAVADMAERRRGKGRSSVPASDR